MTTLVSSHNPAKASQWSSRSLGSRFQHNVFRLLVRLRALPLARMLLAMVVFYYALLPKVRSRSLPYIRRRFGVSSEWHTFLHAYRLYHAFGEVLLERTIAVATGHVPLTSEGDDAKSIIRQALARGKGCLLLSAHVGAWQLGLAALDSGEAPVHVLQWRDPGDVDRHYFEEGRGNPVNIIDAAEPVEALVRVTTVLRQGHMVVIMGDRRMDNIALSGQEATVKVPFLGDVISLPVKVYALASITGAPLIMAFTVRESGIIRPFLCEEIPVPHGVNHRDAQQFLSCAQQFIQGLERFTAAHPYQFYNFHNLWLDAHDHTGNTNSS